MAIIGIDMGGSTIDGGLVVSGKIKTKVSVNTNAHLGAETMFKMITIVIDRLFNRNVKAIGIGIPGHVNPKKGITMCYTTVSSFSSFPIKKLLEKKYKVPVFIDNDANCFALGESEYGKAKKFKNSVSLILGTGLGSGIIINNKIYHGKNFGAGEFDHIKFKNSNLEKYSSGQFFNKFKTTGKDLFKKAKSDDKKALKIFEQYGKYVAYAISIIIDSIDPDIIILGAGTSKAYKFFKKSMLKELEELIPKDYFDNINIKVSSNTIKMAILGAVSLCD